MAMVDPLSLEEEANKDWFESIGLGWPLLPCFISWKALAQEDKEVGLEGSL